MWYMHHKRRKAKRLWSKMHRQYYDALVKISLESRTLSHSEIAERLHYNSQKRGKKAFSNHMVLILFEIYNSYGSQINEYNFQELQTVFQIGRFLEHNIRYSGIRTKVDALKIIEGINTYVSEAVLVRILYHRNPLLRFSARCAYLWLSQGDPFRFLNEDTSINLTCWDMMNVHNGLVYRKNVKHNAMQFSKWLNSSIEESTKRFILQEIRFSDSREDIPTVTEYITSRNPRISAEAITTLGVMKYEAAAGTYMEIYAIQPEEVKRAIIDALRQLPSQANDTFLYNTYEKEDNVLTRLGILRALYSHQGKGQQLFAALEQAADSHTQILFQHVKNPLITHIEQTS
jgi:hypothetical protein